MQIGRVQKLNVSICPNLNVIPQLKSFPDFQVSEAFIIKTYDPAPEQPAEKEIIPPGMGYDHETEPTTDFKQVFLVEPRRLSSAVLKYSGTLGVTNRSEKRSATMTAFSHWVIESTACQYMFADIQGMLNFNGSRL